MNLRDQLNERSKKMKSHIAAREEITQRILNMLPQMMKLLENWINELLDNTEGVRINIRRKNILLHYNDDYKVLGDINLPIINIEFWDKRVKFELDEGIIFIGALAKINITSSVPSWVQKLNMKTNGIFIATRENEPTVHVFASINDRNEMREFNRNDLEALLLALLT